VGASSLLCNFGCRLAWPGRDLSAMESDAGGGASAGGMDRRREGASTSCFFFVRPLSVDKWGLRRMRRGDQL
jgi:hypothetical protein